MSSEVISYDEQTGAVRKAFEQEFERFARFQGSQLPAGLSLADAETWQRELGELRTRQTGKKSELAAIKKTSAKLHK